MLVCAGLAGGAALLPASAAVAPLGLGTASGTMYEWTYGGPPTSCYFTVSFSGRMPADGHVVTVRNGSARSAAWNCGSASTVKLPLTAVGPRGTLRWVCFGSVSGAGATFVGFHGTTATCHSVSGLGGNFSWRLQLLVKEPATYQDANCDPFKAACNTQPYVGAYRGFGAPALP